VAGLAGTPHGIYFEEGQYTQFQGNSFNANNNTNIVHQIDPRLEISTDIINDDSVIFSRMTGAAGSESIITISVRSNPEKNRVIIVGPGGGIGYE
jgi:hypothetical protein